MVNRIDPDTEKILVEMWPRVPGFILKNWSTVMHRGNPMLSFDELHAAADHALLDLAGGFMQWCREHNLEPSVALFWSMAIQKINWYVLRHLKKFGTTADSLDELHGDADDEALMDADLIRTQLSRHQPPSMMQSDAVDLIVTMPTRNTVILALRYFDELSLDQIAELVELSPARMSQIIAEVGRTVLAHMMNQVVDHPRDVEPPSVTRWEVTDGVKRWVQENYGCDVYSYLGYVTHHYRADVSYLVDIINRAHGIGQSKSAEPRPSRFTPETREEIRRRLAAGEKAIDLANEYQCSKGYLYELVRVA